MKHDVLVDGASHTVWVFIPKNYRAGERYPTILFLHGLFEAGNKYSNSDKISSAPSHNFAPFLIKS